MARSSPEREVSILKPDAAFAPGFRMSKLDMGFILLVLVSSPLLGQLSEQLALGALFALFHFFLFCNVLRAKRPLELLWTAVFVGLWSSAYLWDVSSWPLTYALALAVTVAVILAQVLLPSYHGAFWAVLNPQLPQWWERQTRGKAAP
jgi:hypothetical protein